MKNTAFSSSVTITRPANTTAYSAGDVIGIDPGVLQVETATAAGTITAAVAQVETATVVATITVPGNATVVVTGAALENSPKTFSVAVANADDASAVAGKIRTALAADENIADAYTVSGATDKVVLTAINAVANDATLNISVANGTCTGITAAATSANTTAGVAAGTGNASVTITSALISGSPITISVPVVAGDLAAAWAAKVRTALNADSRVTSYYTVGGAGATITLTTLTAAANDATLNIALANGTCTGITPAASSADTTAGSVTSATAGSAINSFPFTTDKGSAVFIRDVNLQWHNGTKPAGAAAFTLHLYNASPDAIVDNAAWDLSSAGDRGKYLGSVAIADTTDLGSTLFSQNSGVNKMVRLAADSNTLYGVLQTVGGFTPVSSDVYKLTINATAAA